MSFTVSFYSNQSEPERFDKTLAWIGNLSGVLKEGASIIDPVITFECSLADLASCNYLYIEEFGRYYFVTDIRAVAYNLCEVSAHVDVLSSFAAQIRGNEAIVSRQQNRWNLYLNDGSFRVYQDRYCGIRAFPRGFDTTSYVLAVAGGGTQNGGVSGADVQAGNDAVRVAYTMVGVPYVWGGYGRTGVDCSGLVYYCYNTANNGQQALDTWRGDTDALAVDSHFTSVNGAQYIKPGGIILSTGSDPDHTYQHVGIYVGNSQVIHAPTAGQNVSVVSLSSYLAWVAGPYLYRNFTG